MLWGEFVIIISKSVLEYWVIRVTWFMSWVRFSCLSSPLSCLQSDSVIRFGNESQFKSPVMITSLSTAVARLRQLSNFGMKSLTAWFEDEFRWVNFHPETLDSRFFKVGPTYNVHIISYIHCKATPFIPSVSAKKFVARNLKLRVRDIFMCPGFRETHKL